MTQHAKDEAPVVGVAFIGLFKCEDEECGALFVREVNYLFQGEGAQAALIECPYKHKRVKFIQTVDKAPLVAPQQQ